MKKSKIKLILKDNWLAFLKIYGKKVRKNVKKEVEKVLACGDLSKWYIEFICNSCKGSKKIGFSCKSRFCTSCGKVYTDNWIDNIFGNLTLIWEILPYYKVGDGQHLTIVNKNSTI